MPLSLEDRIKRLEGITAAYWRAEQAAWRYFSTPFTSASWSGNSYSTTAKAVIDFSAVFGIPAGVKAVMMRIACRDSASFATAGCFVMFSPANDANVQVIARASGRGNDLWEDHTSIVICDANGDAYIQLGASGANTLDVYLQIWGYQL